MTKKKVIGNFRRLLRYFFGEFSIVGISPPTQKPEITSLIISNTFFTHMDKVHLLLTHDYLGIIFYTRHDTIYLLKVQFMLFPKNFSQNKIKGLLSLKSYLHTSLTVSYIVNL